MNANDVSTAELVKKALDEAKELLRLEVALAKEEVAAELARVRSAAIGFVLAQSVAILALAMALSAAAFASGAFVSFALVAAAVLVLLAGGAAFFGYRSAAAPFLTQTRARLGEDVQRVKEGAHGH